MIVYGDPAFECPLPSALSLLARRLDPPARRNRDADLVRETLILAGQVEQGLADLPVRSKTVEAAHDAVCIMTDLLARALLGGEADAVWAGRMAADLKRHGLEEGIVLTLKVPEGFAFYSLYPEQYAASARLWLGSLHGEKPRGVLVIGLRSIGTTLSAVVAAALGQAGVEARRVTVRPSGHPYARHTDLPPDVCGGWPPGDIHALVVDEGPGRSGSSMASVGEALAAIGVRPERIAFLPGHAGQPGGEGGGSVGAWWLRAPRYVANRDGLRWRGLSITETLAARTAGLLQVPVQSLAIDDLGGGRWRAHLSRDETVAYPAFERPKYRIGAPDGRALLWKFEGMSCASVSGLSSAGEAMAARERLAVMGWTSAPAAAVLGFVATPWIDGKPLSPADADRAMLEALGRYMIDASQPPLPPGERAAAFDRLAGMLFWNAHEALGEEAAAGARDLATAVREAVVADSGPSCGDGRIAPQEWLRMPDGRLLKTDCAGHRHDHTVVGPQPVAWDIAGAIVEWELDEEKSAALFCALASCGIAPPNAAVLAFYRRAYAAFALGLLTMAGDGDAEALRRREAYLREILAALRA